MNTINNISFIILIKTLTVISIIVLTTPYFLW